jgi:HEAT repeat protein
MSRRPERRRSACFLLWIVSCAIVVGPHDGAHGALVVDQAADERQRLTGLVSLVEGPNNQTVRLTGARELLRISGDAVQEHVLRILRVADAPAQTAMAQALADVPGSVGTVHIEPLLDLLDSDGELVRQAAIAALSRVPATIVAARLRQLVTDTNETTEKRLGALAALGRTLDRESLETVVSALSSDESRIAEAALNALREAVALEFQTGPAEAIEWWRRTREMPWDQWQQLQIQRLGREMSRLSQQTRDLELRLTTTMRESYFRLHESERDKAMLGYLSDPTASVRLLGLELVQSRVAEGKSVTPEIALLTDGLLSDATASVRAAAARTVTAFRNSEDAPRFIELIAHESDGPTRMALINGLGYLGDSETVAALVRFMDLPDEGSVDEVVGALGRLAERDVIPPDQRGEVAETLMRRYPEVCGRNGMESRLLWAMGRLADARCGPLFMQRLASDASATTRSAALRGLTILIVATDSGAAPERIRTREWLDAAMPAAIDPDIAIRRLAIETLAKAGETDAHLETLWDRSFPPRENEESIRKLAWSGVLANFTKRPAEIALDYVAKFRDQTPDDVRRRLELLQLVEAKLVGEPTPRPDLLADVRTDLAAALVGSGQVGAAISAYLAALADVRVANPEAVEGVSLTLLRLALLNARYDDQVAAALGESTIRADAARLWSVAREEIEARSGPDLLPQAIEMVDALAARPPAQFGPEILAELADLQSRIRGLQQTYHRRAVDEALVRLREQPDDALARQIIVDLGTDALPGLVVALRAVLFSDPLDVEAERRIHDLLKQVKPEWPGFSTDADLEQKLESLSEPSL